MVDTLMISRVVYNLLVYVALVAIVVVVAVLEGKPFSWKVALAVPAALLVATWF